MSVSPDDAYRFALGEPVAHPYSGVRVQLTTPLDFLVVTDHAEFLGGIKGLITFNNRGYTYTQVGEMLMDNVSDEQRLVRCPRFHHTRSIFKPGGTHLVLERIKRLSAHRAVLKAKIRELFLSS